MPGEKKIAFLTLLFFILFLTVLIVHYSVEQSYYPKSSPEGFWVTVQGNVYPSNDVDPIDFDLRPQSVHVYYPYSIRKFLCDGTEIEFTNINWIDSANGNYKFSFWVPIETDVILTTGCSRCDNKTIQLKKSQPILEADLVWGIENCKEYNLQISNNSKSILQKSQDLYVRTSSDLESRDDYDASDRKSIRNDLGSSLDKISDAESIIERNESEALNHALSSLWYAHRASYKLTIYDLKYCLIQTDDIIEKYNDSCYMPDYPSYLSYQSSKSSYRSFSNDNLLGWTPDDRDDVEHLKNDINGMYNNKRNLIGVLSNKCERPLRTFNKTFEYQENICKNRKVSLFTLKRTQILLLIGIGILVGRRFYLINQKLRKKGNKDD